MAIILTQIAQKLLRRGAALAILSFLGLAVSAGSGLAEVPGVASKTSWPMFRGSPELDGIAVGKLPDQLDLSWSFATGGPIRSSAAIVDDRVFIGSDDGKLYALNLKDGSKIWEFTTEWPIEPTPLVLNGLVYIGADNGFLYALDAKDGTLKWKFETQDKIAGSPNWIKTGDGKYRVVFGSHDFFLYCLDAETGAEIWRFESANFINGCPAVSEGMTAFGGCDALLHVINLTNGTEEKQVEAGAYIAGSVAIKDRHAYFGHYENEYLSIDIEKGEVEWRYTESKFPYFSSPAVTEDRVIFGGRDKKLHCVNRKDGTDVWSFATRGRVDSSPVVSGDQVIVGSDDGRLYLVSLNEGREIWSYEIGDSITSSPAVIEGMTVIGCQDGSVYAFGEKKK